MDFDKYNIESSEKDLLNAIKNISQYMNNPNQANIELGYITNLLNLKRQEEILDQQNEFNKESIGEQKKIYDAQNEFNGKALKENRSLAKATWILAFATIALCIITILVVIIKK